MTSSCARPRGLRPSDILITGVLAALSFWGAARADLPGSGTAMAPPSSPTGQDTAPEDRRLVQLGAGDSVTVEVYGQPDLTSTVYVAENGTISLPLVGEVQVAGLSSVEAAARVEKALKDGQFLVDPHVTILVTQSKSQRVSVLGEVKAPGRYPIEPNTTVLELLAQAGGVNDTSSYTIYIVRPDAKGVEQRIPVDLQGFSNHKEALPTEILHAGDTLVVPKADHFYMYGEVAAPGMYRIEPGMTIIEALARAGGVTARGSERRIDIKRLEKNGRYSVRHAKPGDLVQPDDVIRVKESIF